MSSMALGSDGPNNTFLKYNDGAKSRITGVAPS